MTFSNKSVRNYGIELPLPRPFKESKEASEALERSIFLIWNEVFTAVISFSVPLILLLSNWASSHGFRPLLNRKLFRFDGVLLRFCLPGVNLRGNS